MHDSVFDVVVLGGGVAGLSAAASAAEAGLSVVLAEKTGAVGGSSAMSGGYFAFSYTPEQAAAGVQDSVELFRSDLLGSGEGIADETLVDAYLAAQDEAYEWLKSKGVEFGALELSSGMSAARAHNSKIETVLSLLHEALTADGGTTLLNTKATQLVTDEKSRVTGVVVDTADGERRISGRLGVVIATGGFSRSPQLLTTFAPEQLGAIPYGGRGNTGDGLKLAWRLGAGLADMSYVSATFGSHPDTGEDMHELLTAYYLGAIIVNENGRRFVDESQGYKILGARCLEQPGALGFELFDSVVRSKSEPGVPLVDIDALEELGHVLKADTLEELAEVSGIDKENLLETVKSYNAAVAGEQADEQGRTHLVNGVGDLLPIETGPFYAYPAKPLMTTTYCGLTITPEAAVRAVDGELIEGLYAIGEVTGGFHGPNYMTGTSLGKGVVFGRIVATHLAETASASAERSAARAH